MIGRIIQRGRRSHEEEVCFDLYLSRLEHLLQGGPGANQLSCIEGVL